MPQDTKEKIVSPNAMIYRLFERDGTMWQLGAAWPAPKDVADAAAIDCVISCILRFDSEVDDNGDKVEVEPYFQIIGLPIEGGKFAKRKVGVTTDIGIGDVFRTEGLQDVEALAIYAAEMVGTSPSPGDAQTSG
jgi:hypothetical protein